MDLEYNKGADFLKVSTTPAMVTATASGDRQNSLDHLN